MVGRIVKRMKSYYLDLVRLEFYYYVPFCFMCTFLEDLAENKAVNQSVSMDFTIQPISPRQQQSGSLLSPGALISESETTFFETSKSTPACNISSQSLDFTCVPTINTEAVSSCSFKIDTTCNSTLFHVPPSSDNCLVGDDSQSVSNVRISSATQHCSHFNIPDPIDQRSNFLHETSCNCTNLPVQDGKLANTSVQAISQPELDFTCESEPTDISSCGQKHINCTIEKKSFGPEAAILKPSLQASFRVDPKNFQEPSLGNDIQLSTLMLPSLQTPQKHCLSDRESFTQELVPDPDIIKPKDSKMTQMLSNLRRSFDSVEISTIALPEAVVLSSTRSVDNSISDLDSANSTFNVGQKSVIPSPSGFGKFGEILKFDETINDKSTPFPMKSSPLQVKKCPGSELSDLLVQVKAK